LLSGGIMAEGDDQQWIRSSYTSYQSAFTKDWKPTSP